MAQDKTYIEIGSNIPANGTSAKRNPSGAAAMNIQINAGQNVTTVVEGVLADIQGAEQPQESDWVEVARFVGPGIFPLKNVPSLFRVKALGGTIERVRGMGYRDPKAVPETIPASLADITSAVDPIVEPVRTTAGAAQALAEQADTKADSASSALGNLTLVQLATRPISAGPQFADGSRWVGQPSGTVNGGTVVAAADGVWVRELPEGTLTPEMFGARGDGVTDDTAAIVALFAASEGRTVSYRGTYLIDPLEPLQFRANSTHRMVSGGTCKFLLKTNARLNGPTQHVREFVFKILTDNVLLEDFTLDGGVTVAADGSVSGQTKKIGGVIGYNARNPKLVRYVARNCLGAGFVIQNCPGGRVDGADVQRCGMASGTNPLSLDGNGNPHPNADFGAIVGADANLTPSDPYYVADYRVSRSVFKFNGLDGLGISAPGVVVDGCVSNGNGNAVGVREAANIGAAGFYFNYGRGITFRDCHAEGNTGNGFDTGPNGAFVGDITYDNCTAVGNGHAGIQIDDATGAILRGCRIRDNGQNTVNTQRAGVLIASYGGVSRVKVVDCEITDTRAGAAKTQTYGVGLGAVGSTSWSVADVEISGGDLSGNKLGAVGTDSAKNPQHLVTSGYLSVSNVAGARPEYTFPAGTHQVTALADVVRVGQAAGAASTPIINGIGPSRQGATITLYQFSNPGSVTVSSSGGNIQLRDYGSLTLAPGQAVTLQYIDTAWLEISRRV